ncbi:MAG: hypothetical protein GuXV1_gp2 [Guiyang xinmovirus 1]|nr:MAG: hypothetical protein GuXV1_gp2 [Guiyang xinmovirus 1]
MGKHKKKSPRTPKTPSKTTSNPPTSHKKKLSQQKEMNSPRPASPEPSCSQSTERPNKMEILEEILPDVLTDAKKEILKERRSDEFFKERIMTLDWDELKKSGGFLLAFAPHIQSPKRSNTYKKKLVKGLIPLVVKYLDSSRQLLKEQSSEDFQMRAKAAVESSQTLPCHSDDNEDVSLLRNIQNFQSEVIDHSSTESSTESEPRQVTPRNSTEVLERIFQISRDFNKDCVQTLKINLETIDSTEQEESSQVSYSECGDVVDDDNQHFSDQSKSEHPSESLKSEAKKIPDKTSNVSGKEKPTSPLQKRTMKASSDNQRTSHVPIELISGGNPMVTRYLDDCRTTQEEKKFQEKYKNLPKQYCPKDLFISNIRPTVINCLIETNHLKLGDNWMEQKDQEPRTSWNLLNRVIIKYLNNTYQDQGLDINEPAEALENINQLGLVRIIKEAIAEGIQSAMTGSNSLGGSSVGVSGFDGDVTRLRKTVESLTGSVAQLNLKIGIPERPAPLSFTRTSSGLVGPVQLHSPSTSASNRPHTPITSHTSRHANEEDDDPFRKH